MTMQIEEIDGIEVMTPSIDGGTALAALNKSEIDIQITTAKHYPRSIKKFKVDAMELATLDEDTAGSMFYKLPRGGKSIEGPSVRLAEVVGACWGNLRYDSDIVAIDAKFVTAMGSAFDLEKNVAIRTRIKRRITDKNGRRFNDDMIQVTSNAACSIALRAAIFKVIPFALIKGIYEEAKLCSIGKSMTIQERRGRAIDWFAKAGVTQDRVYLMLGIKGIDDLSIDHLITLTGLRTAIKDGDTSIEEAFPLQRQDDVSGHSRTEQLAEKFAKKPEGNGNAAPPVEAPKVETKAAERVDASTGEVTQDAPVAGNPLDVSSIDKACCGAARAAGIPVAKFKGAFFKFWTPRAGEPPMEKNAENWTALLNAITAGKFDYDKGMILA